MTDNASKNPMTDDNTRKAILATLAREVSELNQRINAALGGQDAVTAPRAKAATPERHPLESAILDALAPGKAIRKTELAKRFKVNRASIHYHCKRLLALVYSVETLDDSGRDVDYVILRSALQIPGIDN
jgi:hypothetical protein